MKLVDILASELKHWPSTRTAAVGQSNSGSLHLNEEPRHGSEFFGWTTCKFTMAEDCQSAWVTRAEWQAAVDALNAPKVVEWDGVGDPPVGVVCQYRVLNGPWYTCEVGYSFFDGEHRCFVIKCQHLGFDQVCRIEPGSEDSVGFRPFRTTEQVAAEEIEAIREFLICEHRDGGLIGIAKALHESGYRKEPKPCGS